MMKLHSARWRALLLAVLLGACVNSIAQPADSALDAAVYAHIAALEQAANDPIDTVAARFDAQHFSAQFKRQSSAATRHELLQKIGMAASKAGSRSGK